MGSTKLNCYLISYAVPYSEVEKFYFGNNNNNTKPNKHNILRIIEQSYKLRQWPAQLNSYNISNLKQLEITINEIRKEETQNK